MPGLYLHIPFCKKACHYCNFHFSTSLKYRSEMVEALSREMNIRQSYLPAGQPLQSVYFGGGTPSLLAEKELGLLLDQAFRLFPIAPGAEITLEANPDDLTPEYLRWLRHTPVNRLSIGIQSFADADLQFMNRAHDSREAVYSLNRALDAGFENITADLIYGSPTTSDQQWQANIDQLTALDIPHISAYCLTVEPGTALAHFVKKGAAAPVDEEKAASQFDYLIDTLEARGYLHYEISNFGRPDRLAVHNTSYWKGEPYLGIGPSAHSFDGASRQWNIANNAQYMRAIGQGQVPAEMEILRPEDHYNEWVMTRLRTIWGCERAELQTRFTAYEQHFHSEIQPFVEKGWVEDNRDGFRLTREGKHFADAIAAGCFI